MPEGYV